MTGAQKAIWRRWIISHFIIAHSLILVCLLISEDKHLVSKSYGLLCMVDFLCQSFDFLVLKFRPLMYDAKLCAVMYLENNPGGITLYGWTVDRSLMNTIFFIELSLVLFVLGRTTVFTYQSLPWCFCRPQIDYPRDLDPSFMILSFQFCE